MHMCQEDSSTKGTASFLNMAGGEWCRQGKPYPALLRAASASPSSTECTPPTWAETCGRQREGRGTVHAWPR